MPDLLIAAACITGLWLYAHCLRRRYRRALFAIYEMCSPAALLAALGLSHEGTGSATRP